MWTSKQEEYLFFVWENKQGRVIFLVWTFKQERAFIFCVGKQTEVGIIFTVDFQTGARMILLWSYKQPHPPRQNTKNTWPCKCPTNAAERGSMCVLSYGPKATTTARGICVLVHVVMVCMYLCGGCGEGQPTLHPHEFTCTYRPH